MKKKQTVPQNRSKSPRGAATERILTALAEELPTVHDRESFINSYSLAQQFGKSPETLSAREKNVARRTLGRLISQNIIGEALFPKGNHEKIGLTGAGLISVSINLDSLTRKWNEWKNELVAWKEKHQIWSRTQVGLEPVEPFEPTQERIIENIISDTRLWIKSSTYKPAPLVLLGISIVHGSSDFDVLISALYRDDKEFMRYIREVIQRIPFVQKTHTMQVGAWEGFPDIGHSVLLNQTTTIVAD